MSKKNYVTLDEAIAEELKKHSELVEAYEMELRINERLINEIPLPYTIGKRPEPKRWEDKGIQHKLL